ncbi:MAG: metalloregulator ArsR/SmtB family transcription factor [Burkholderiaceae bacterium]
MDETQALAALSALSQATRLRAFRELVGAGPDGLTPGQLAQTLDCSSTALSFHLKELTQAGLLHSERQGRHLVYRAGFEQMTALLAYLTAHCCQGEPCALTSDPSADSLSCSC